MKTKLTLLLAGAMAVFCSSIASAQIIYSNNFSLGGAGNISNTPPTVADEYAGGTTNAVWTDALGVNDTGFLQQNGLDNSPINGNSWLLPFTPPPTNSYVYIATVNVSFTNNPGSWIGMGFAQTIPTNETVSNGRFADSPVNGYDWAILSDGSMQSFQGPRASPSAGIGSSALPADPTTDTLQILLDTQPTQWTMVCYVNGVQEGAVTNFGTVNPTNLTGIGLTQTALSDPTAVQYNTFTLATTRLPFIVQQPAASSTVSSGSVYTNIVTVLADTNGGKLAYQWYLNGAPLVNSGAVSGATTNILKISPITTPYQSTNYYVIVTNNYGSFTSAPASVLVLTNAFITSPLPSTNVFTLYGGTSISGTNYVGSSPSFSVSVAGAPPLIYQWLTNGVAVSGATNSILAFTNLQANGPTNFACVVSNIFGAETNAWPVVYTQTPLAPYPQAVLASTPLDFWRLNEPDNGLNNGEAGVVCDDYQSANDGIFTNVDLGEEGYNSQEPTETSVAIAPGADFANSYAGNIHNVDFATPNTANAEFTVEGWAQCFGDVAGAPVITEGPFNNGEEFGLGSDTNGATRYQFYVHAANGTLYKADSSILCNDGNWHHLVGVCDQANGVVQLYVDGVLSASTAIPAKAGIIEASSPLSIGASPASAGGNYTIEFNGNIDDVATYLYPLSAGQVISHYASFGLTVPVTAISSPPPTNFVYLSNQTLTIPVTVAGSGPLGFYWTNLTAGGVLSSGQTNTSGGLAATLSVPNAAGLNGDQLELVVTNGTSSTNWLVTLFSPAPPIALSYTSPILYSNYFNGGTYSVAGLPLTAANALVGGTNATWIDVCGTNNPFGLAGNGVDVTTNLGDGWVVPLTPHSGYVYTINTSVTFTGNPGSWTGPGFAQLTITNSTKGSFNGTGISGYDWPIMTESSGNIQYFPGPSTSLAAVTNSPTTGEFFTAGAGTHVIQDVLDTTGTQWKYYLVIDGKSTATYTYANNPTNINAVGLQANSQANPNVIQWNYFAVTQVAPVGAPPYAYAPAPPANVTLLAGSALSIPTTTYGSGPFGYYWNNTSTATVLVSGTTNNTAPLGASLAVGSVPGSWNGNTLALVMTNAYGTNISFVLLNVTNAIIIPTNSPTITGFSLVGNNVVINATNGQSGDTYYLLGSSNLTTPLTQWVPVSTNFVVTNGVANGFTFTGTNAANATNMQTFYILSNTN